MKEISCIDIETYLRYVDASLGDREQSLVRAHLERCSKCQELAHRLAFAPHLDGDAHPDETVLADYAGGRLAGGILPLTEEHLGRCPHCRDAIQMLAGSGGEPAPVPASVLDQAISFGSKKAAPRVSGRVRPTHKPRTWEKWVGTLAAVAAVLVLFVVLGDRSPHDGTSVIRGEESAPSVEGAELGIAPAGEIRSAGEESIRFSWHAAPHAALYRIRLLDEKGRAVASAETSTTSVDLALESRLTPGEIYSWDIEIVRDDGTRYHSAMTEFTWKGSRER